MKAVPVSLPAAATASGQMGDAIGEEMLCPKALAFIHGERARCSTGSLLASSFLLSGGTFWSCPGDADALHALNAR